MQKILLSDFKNNQHISKILQANIREEKLHHGYILEGPLSAEKTQFAKNFAKGILCKEAKGVGCGTCSICQKIETENYIDLTIVRKNEAKGSKVKSIKNQDILELQERLSKKPFEGERNIALITDADTMSASAFNSFLKTLEEPPVGTVIIILTENSKILPETIRSRCVKFFLNEETEPGLENQGKKKAKELLDMIVNKEPYYKVKPFIQENEKDKEQAFLFLDNMESVARDMIVSRDKRISREYGFNIVKEIEAARREIQIDVSRAYALKKLILKIGG